MNEQRLTRLLRSKATAPERRGWRCPDEALLAAYVDGGLPGRDRARVESHVADCAACLGQVSFLAHGQAGSGDAVIARGVARARDLVVAPSGQWRALAWRWGAAAAGIVCVSIVVSLQFGPPGAPSAPSPPRLPLTSAPRAEAAPVPGAAPAAGITQAAPQDMASAVPAFLSPNPSDAVRRPAAVPSTVAITVPRSDATLSRRDLAFRWRGVPGALYYEIRLVTDEGTVVWQGHADNPDVRLPPDLLLQEGGRYFVTVRAHLSGGGTLRSAAVPFFIGR